MTYPPIEFIIDELVLEGFLPADRHRIAEAVQQELIRQFTTGAVPPALTRSATVGDIEAGEFHMQSGARPAAIGAGIGRAIHGGITR